MPDVRDADHRSSPEAPFESRGPSDSSTVLWGAVSLWLLLAVGLLGGAPRPAAVLLGALAFLGAVVFRRVLFASMNGFALFYATLALWTTLSAVPVPCAAVRWVAPFAASVWQDALSPLGALPPAYCSLSVAPVATVQAALNWSAYGVIAAAAHAVARQRGLLAILLSVLGVAVLVALLTLVHALLGIEHLFGLPALPAKGEFGPASVLVNPNNLAGFMNLGTFAALGLLGSRRAPVSRPLLAVGGALCIATAISSASRGGVLALAFGIVAWGALVAVRRLSSGRAGRSELVRQAPFALVVVVAGVLLAVLGSNPNLERELFGDDVGKVRELGQLAMSIDQVDWSGVGRGAFDSMSARFTGEARNFTHEFAENFALSWLFEWGPVVGGGALLALAWLLAPGRLKVRGHASAEGAWLGLLVLLLQNFGDLGLELPGLAGAFAAVAGGLSGSRSWRTAVHTATHPARSMDGRLVFGALSALLLVTTLWTLSSGPALSVLRARVARSVEKALGAGGSGAEQEEARAAVAASMERFPGEPYFVLAGGWLALHGGQDGMPWAAEALRRAPRSARAHVLTAEVLARRGALDQALLHVRRAIEADPALGSALAARVAAATTDPRRLEAAVPAGVLGGRFLLELLSALPAGSDPRARRHLLRLAVTRAPKDIRVQAAEGWALLSDLRIGSAPCPLDQSEASCPVAPGTSARIRTLAELTRHSPTCEGLRIEAALLQQEGRGAQAVDLLAACPSCSAPGHCARDRVELSLEHGDEDERRLALGAFRAGMCDSPSHCAEAEAWLSGVFMRRSQAELALVHAWRAAEFDPSAQRYLAAARVARAAGRVDRVEVALDRASRMGGRDPELEQWAATRRSLPSEALK